MSESTDIKISVVICTRNPREVYFARTLAALRSQSLPVANWELIVVDNGSTPSLAERVDLSWHPQARILREETRGFTPALLCAVPELKGQLVVLVHDDNLLAPDYLATALILAETWPKLGAWGGQFTAEYERVPNPKLKPFLHYLAVNQVAQERWSNKLYDYEAAPAGAGMCVRPKVLRKWAQLATDDPRRRELGRREGGLTSCEDFDIAFVALDLGLGMGVFPILNILHLIPAGRVEPDYLLRLVEGHAYSTVLLHALRSPSKPPPDDWLAALRRWRYRRTLDPIQRQLHDAWRRGELAGFRRLSE